MDLNGSPTLSDTYGQWVSSTSFRLGAMGIFHPREWLQGPDYYVQSMTGTIDVITKILN
jgi:hypothetical protein